MSKYHPILKVLFQSTLTLLQATEERTQTGSSIKQLIGWMMKNLPGMRPRGPGPHQCSQCLFSVFRSWLLLSCLLFLARDPLRPQGGCQFQDCILSTGKSTSLKHFTQRPQTGLWLNTLVTNLWMRHANVWNGQIWVRSYKSHMYWKWERGFLQRKQGMLPSKEMKTRPVRLCQEKSIANVHRQLHRQAIRSASPQHTQCFSFIAIHCGFFRAKSGFYPQPLLYVCSGPGVSGPW